MDILAVVAHPDDAALHCGGTLAVHVNRDEDVHVAYMTRGEYGSLEQQDEDSVAEQRTREATQACETLGTTAEFLSFRDGRLEYSLNNRLRLVTLIRRHQPRLLLTHFKEDHHPDHRITSRLVTDAYYMASLPMVQTQEDPFDPDNVYYFGRSTAGFEPDVYVDISSVLERKEAAVRCHRSQLEFLRNHGGVDSEFDDPLEDVRSETRTFGRRSGVAHAEGFVPLHPRAVRYLP